MDAEATRHDGDGELKRPMAIKHLARRALVRSCCRPLEWPAWDQEHRRSSRSVLAEVNGDTPSFVFEDGDEFETGTEAFEVLAQCRAANISRMLELRDRTLGDLQAYGEFGLARGLGMAQCPQSDLLEGLGALGGQPVGCSGAGVDLLAEFGNLVRA